jgi:mRNA-degrading endonuclease RelE of RelBE toxin-antitoxin system
MAAFYIVKPTTHFGRQFHKLMGKHSDLPQAYEAILAILRVDPYNISRIYNIKKLTEVPAGEGQYRIRAGRWRFRYDIKDKLVYLKTCGLRREDTYRA